MTEPDEPERLFLPDIAKMAGVSYSTIKTYYLRGQARFPEPEIQRVQAAGEPYRTRPWWRRDVIEAWLAQRPGKGNYHRDGISRGPYVTAYPVRAVCPTCLTSRPASVTGKIRRHNSCPGGGMAAAS
jgi:predicted DNA-binding transcriptional regulator AlpA